MKKRIYFDTEFTGLNKTTDLISIGLVSDCGKTFYAETTDYDVTKIDEWLEKNVISNLCLNGFNHKNDYRAKSDHVKYRGNKEGIKNALHIWFNKWKDSSKLELWSDVKDYDVVLLHDLFGGAFGMPKHIYYIVHDLATAFLVKNIDPDINREEYAEICDEYGENKHNSLWDARVIKECVEKLQV